MLNSTASESIFVLLNTEDEEKRDKLTENWRDRKLAELNFIGVVGALIAGCVTSTGSWPTILRNGTLQPWTVRACWYNGLLFSLTAVILAASQTIRLHRISAHRDALVRLRTLLGTNTRDKKGLYQTRVFQAYIWQMASFFLSLGVLAMLCGLFILVWSSTGSNGTNNWWDANAKVAVTISIVGVICGLAFIFVHVLVSWESEHKPPHQSLQELEKD